MFKGLVLLLLIGHPLFFLSLPFDTSNSQFVWNISSARAGENDPLVCGGTAGVLLDVKRLAPTWRLRRGCWRKEGRENGGEVKLVLNEGKKGVLIRMMVSCGFVEET